MKILNLILFLALAGRLYGQNYIEYYDLSNQGDKQIYLKDYPAALQNFEQAMARVEYVHTWVYHRASLAAAQSGNNEKARLYAGKALVQGLDPQFLKEKPFSRFRKSTQYKSLKDSLAQYQQQYEAGLNRNYQREIDSLIYIDQNIIRGNKSLKGNFKIDRPYLEAHISELDSTNFIRLIQLIDANGFPSEQRIGPQSAESASILIHHHFRLPQNTQYLPLATEAVKKGEYAPHAYAWMYDQSLVFRKEEPYFYFAVASISSLNEEQRAEIDRRRAEFGIKPLEATPTTFRKNLAGRKVVTMRRLW
ncbi:MAG: hypothetical protein H6581_16810 [Bacteroidia bacterium]|nr:hypothetical protein [Bacteroidia bacterium]